VQYARHTGATVIGLAGGPAKTALVAANGADLAVDYTDPAWPDKVRAYLGGRPATLVLDGVGGDIAREATALLSPTGQHLVFGWSGEGIRTGGPYLVENLSQQVLGPAMLAKTGGPNPLRTLELRALTEAATGRLTPAVHRFPLAEAATAHRALENRATTGKVVLEP
jgi:NADPH2:quinone reductase